MSVPLTFMYRNHRGEVGLRRVRPDSVRWGATEWHPEECWLLRAWDFDKGDHRDFRMADMLGPLMVPPLPRAVVLGAGDSLAVSGVPVESEVVGTVREVDGDKVLIDLSVRPLPGEPS